jgi:UDP-N-acetylmuramate dehydrogenase
VAGLQKAVQVLTQFNYPYFVLGRGTNLLVSDSGIQAAAISLERGFSRVEIVDLPGEVRVGAGLRLNTLLRFCLKQGLGGIEFITGIPGSVGGAIRMNAGTKDGVMADVCRAISICLFDGSLESLPASQLRFSYRKLELPPGAVLFGAELSLIPASRKQMRSRIRSLLKARKETQPYRLPSAGSVFKNPAGDYAGRIIEAVGLKGLRVGDAQISTKHANFIVNRGQARAGDILALIHLAQEKVSQRFGIQLELEIMLIGNNFKLNH